jgi:hypothetical protein
MKRKLIIVAMVTLLLATAAPAWAAGGGEGNRGGDQVRHQQARQPFALVGTITALGTDTITVEVQSGNRQVKPYIGQDLTILVTGSTSYLHWTSAGSVPITFADLGVGNSTNISGVLSGSTFTATRVTIDVPMSCPCR